MKGKGAAKQAKAKKRKKGDVDWDKLFTLYEAEGGKAAFHNTAEFLASVPSFGVTKRQLRTFWNEHGKWNKREAYAAIRRSTKAFIRQHRVADHRRLHPTYAAIRERALLLAKENQVPFKASDGWIRTIIKEMNDTAAAADSDNASLQCLSQVASQELASLLDNESTTDPVTTLTARRAPVPPVAGVDAEKPAARVPPSGSKNTPAATVPTSDSTKNRKNSTNARLHAQMGSFCTNRNSPQPPHAAVAAALIVDEGKPALASDSKRPAVPTSDSTKKRNNNNNTMERMHQNLSTNVVTEVRQHQQKLLDAAITAQKHRHWSANRDKIRQQHDHPAQQPRAKRYAWYEAQPCKTIRTRSLLARATGLSSLSSSSSSSSKLFQKVYSKYKPLHVDLAQEARRRYQQEQCMDTTMTTPTKKDSSLSLSVGLLKDHQMTEKQLKDWLHQHPIRDQDEIQFILSKLKAEELSLSSFPIT